MTFKNIPADQLLFSLDMDSMERALHFMDELKDRYEKELEGDIRMLIIGLMRLSDKKPQDLFGEGLNLE